MVSTATERKNFQLYLAELHAGAREHWLCGINDESPVFPVRLGQCQRRPWDTSVLEGVQRKCRIFKEAPTSTHSGIAAIFNGKTYQSVWGYIVPAALLLFIRFQSEQHSLRPVFHSKYAIQQYSSFLYLEIYFFLTIVRSHCRLGALTWKWAHRSDSSTIFRGPFKETLGTKSQKFYFLRIFDQVLWEEVKSTQHIFLQFP